MPPLRRPPPRAKPAMTATEAGIKAITALSAASESGVPYWQVYGYESLAAAAAAIESQYSAPTAGPSEEAPWKTRSAYGWYKLAQSKAENTRDFRSNWDKEKTKIEKMSVSMFNKKYDFNTTIKADDNERESKFLDSVKDLWMSSSVANQNLQEAKYYLRGCRRSANDSGTWAGRFDKFEPEENDSDYGEDLGDEGEGEERDEIDGKTLVDLSEYR